MATVTAALEALPGVIDAVVILNQTATVTYWPDSGTTGDDMVQAVIDVGYQAEILKGECGV